MGPRSYARIAVLIGLALAGTAATVPPTEGIGGGIGVAEARSRSHGRRTYRHHARRHAGRPAPVPDAEVVELLPPERPADIAPGDVTASLRQDPDETRLARLRDALQSRASNLADDGERAEVAPLEGAAPRSIAFDFDTGLKTTVFANGVTVREPFDREAARRLTPPNPGDKRASADRSR